MILKRNIEFHITMRRRTADLWRRDVSRVRRGGPLRDGTAALAEALFRFAAHLVEATILFVSAMKIVCKHANYLQNEAKMINNTKQRGLRRFVCGGGCLDSGPHDEANIFHHLATYITMLRRPLFVVVVIGTSILLSGCGSINSWLASAMADHIPHWAGGSPPGMPPRPGTDAYDDYAKKLEGASVQTMPQHNQLQQPAEISLKALY